MSPKFKKIWPAVIVLLGISVPIHAQNIKILEISGSEKPVNRQDIETLETVIKQKDGQIKKLLAEKGRTNTEVNELKQDMFKTKALLANISQSVSINLAETKTAIKAANESLKNKNAELNDIKQSLIYVIGETLLNTSETYNMKNVGKVKAFAADKDMFFILDTDEADKMSAMFTANQIAYKRITTKDQIILLANKTFFKNQ